MKDYIRDLVDKQLVLYRSNPDRMISDYNGERQHVDDYNGRQVLELIQNADDEKAEKVEIKLDSTHRLLTISNTGRPFGEKGYRSLLLSNISSKTKEEFIGNKGLGFRSIINWSEEIIVRSNFIDVVFSADIAQKRFEGLFSQEEKEEIRKEQGLSPASVPWAILATPEYHDSEGSEWATKIIIKYKQEYFEDIKSQLKGLKKEVLLFLNHLLCIEVCIDDEQYTTSIEDDDDFKVIGDDRWKVFDSGTKEFPEVLQDKSKNDPQHYNLKIAIPEIIQFKECFLYSFFPTKIELDFPFTIHGTFDLDSARNQLNDTRKNRFVLQRLIDLIVSVAKEYSEERGSWNPLRLLSYKSKNPVMNLLGFYSLIDEARSSEDVIPCLDGRYRKVSEVVYLSDGFSKIILDVDAAEWFPNMVLPIDEDLEFISKLFSRDIPGFHNKVNEISQHLMDYDLKFRAAFIKEISSIANKENLSILVNDKGEVIDAENEEVFTPRTSSLQEIDLPGHVNIEFIHSDLYQHLLNAFEIDSDQKPRDLQRILKEITNIQSYEPAEMLGKIVSSTNRAIRAEPSRGHEFVIDMVTSLYLIFAQMQNPSKLPIGSSPQLINEEGDIVPASRLYFSRGYATGRMIEKSIGKALSKTDLLASPSTLGLDDEEFLCWLGVNRFAKYVSVTDDRGYLDFVQNKIGIPEKFRGAKFYDVTGVEQGLLDKIFKSCSTEEIIYWLIRDPDASSRILGHKKDSVRFERVGDNYGSWSYQYRNNPSYLSYQIERNRLFVDYWITDDKAASLVNKQEFDYAFFDREGISKAEVESVLIHLGAVEKFQDLSFTKINSVLHALPSSDPMGRQSQKLYKMALEYHKLHRESVIQSDIRLFAKTHSASGYFGQGEIYYSDNIRLPSKMVSGYPILNMPPRSGGKQVSKFFNVKNLNDIEIKVLRSSRLEGISEKFNRVFTDIKPFLLAYRLDGMQKNKDVEAKSITNCKIGLYGDVQCENDGQAFELAPNDYVHFDNEYLLRVPPGSTLQDLLKDSDFSDAFAEIVCTQFKVYENRNDFRSILRNEYSDTEHLLKKDLGTDLLNEAKELLGISDLYASFWSVVLDIKGLELDFPLAIENSALLVEVLNLEVDQLEGLNYDDLAYNRYKKFLDVLGFLGVSPVEYNKRAVYKFDFSALHCSCLEMASHRFKQKFEKILHESLSKKSVEDKSQFAPLIGMYEHLDDAINSIAGHARYELSLEYDVLWKDVVTSELGVSLDAKASNVDLRAIYEKNLSVLGIEDVGDLQEAQRSLLYFDDCLEILRQQISGQSTEGDSGIPEETQKAKPSPIPKEPSKTKAKSPDGGYKRPSRASKHSGNRERTRKQSGLVAEDVVYQSLVEEYGKEFVDHMSKGDDTLGYDIRYSKDCGVTSVYVEVKRFTNKVFYLTQNELNFAKRYRDRYEIFLVNSDDRIVAVLDDVDFNDKERFALVENEYKVHFELV